MAFTFLGVVHHDLHNDLRAITKESGNWSSLVIDHRRSAEMDEILLDLLVVWSPEGDELTVIVGSWSQLEPTLREQGPRRLIQIHVNRKIVVLFIRLRKLCPFGFTTKVEIFCSHV